MSLPYPRMRDTSSGLLAIAAFVAYAALYLVAPDVRPILDAITPWGLAGMITAWLAGIVLCVVGEMLRGDRLYLDRWRPWRELAWGLGCFAVALWMAQIVLHATPDVALTGWAIVWQPIVQLGGAALIALAARAGYADGDDHTWRARHGLA